MSDFLIDTIGGRACTLLGLGVSHLPLCEWLCDAGVSVTVYDKKSVAELGERAEILAERGVRFVKDENGFSDIEGEVIFRSPGLRPDIDGLVAASARGAVVTSETELLLSLCRGTTFGITGSDGKTTSTTLTGLFFAEDGRRTRVGGNIGTPLLPVVDDIADDDCTVLELSSFQLMSMAHAPHNAAITNLSPNHLDWHRGMDEYAEAKRHIIGKETRRLVTNADSPVTAEIAREELFRGEREVVLFSSHRSSIEEFSEFSSIAPIFALFERGGVILCAEQNGERPILRVADILIPGRHNVENYMTAIGLTLGYVKPEIYTHVAKTFRGVEHRLEHLRTLDGVDYYNSSIDSSPTRTAAALSALDGRDIVIICGGYDKKIPFAPLAEALCRHARAVVLTGATAEKIRAAIEECPDFSPERLAVLASSDFEDAIKVARSAAHEGGCVLLSPACASFDAFRNFAERGDTFRRIVLSLDTEN